MDACLPVQNMCIEEVSYIVSRGYCAAVIICPALPKAPYSKSKIFTLALLTVVSGWCWRSFVFFRLESFAHPYPVQQTWGDSGI
jgi:hypothetical protein